MEVLLQNGNSGNVASEWMAPTGFRRRDKTRNDEPA